MTGSSRTRSTAVLVAVVALMAGISATPHVASAQDQEPSFEDNPEVSFETLWVQSRRGRLQVNYEVAGADWERLKEADVTLWVTVYFPVENAPPALEPAYTVEMDEASGEAKFPRWLSPPDGDSVGTCISATRPGDNLRFGRGFLCNEVTERKVYGNRRPTSSTATTVRMTYYQGMQPYPLPGTLPGFDPPTPPGLPQPSAGVQ